MWSDPLVYHLNRFGDWVDDNWGTWQLKDDFVTSLKSTGCVMMTNDPMGHIVVNVWRPEDALSELPV